MATRSSSGHADRQAASITLRGTPENLVGVLELYNDGATTRRFRSLRLHESGLTGTRRPGKRRLIVREAVAAGERRRVPVQFSVDPATPPGRYEMTFADDHGEHRAEIDVLSEPRLSLMPDRIEVEAAPGEVVTLPVVLSNSGNVPLELSVLGVMVLEEDQQICLALQRALEAAKGKDYETFLNALIEDLAKKKTDFLRLRLSGTGVTLGVGETRTAELEVHVPANVSAGRTYQARTSIMDEPLFLKLRTRQADTPGGRNGARRRGEGA